MNDQMTQPLSDLVLDPFSYVADMASSIVGLGGNGRPAENNYALHTPYVSAVEGVVHFTIEFQGLTATTGTLNLRVHMISSDGPHARLATAERVALNRLVLAGGRHRIRFEALRGVTYALYGGIIGETDAAAISARVILDRPADPNASPDFAIEARNTTFGAAGHAVSHLVSLLPPALGAPATQLATVSQLREPVARKRLETLGHNQGSAIEQWRSAYIMQALSIYGMAQTGARGLGLDYVSGPVARELAAIDVSIDITCCASDPGAIGLALRRNQLGEAAEFDEHVTVRTAALDPIAADLVNYDFLWTDGAVDRLGNVAVGERFIEAALGCLRPGGLAVHVMRFDPNDDGPALCFRRNDLERLCVVLISRGHEVAEFRIDRKGLLRDADGFSACGIICRKAILKE